MYDFGFFSILGHFCPGKPYIFKKLFSQYSGKKKKQKKLAPPPPLQKKKKSFFLLV